MSANWNDEMSIFKESFGIDFFEGHVSKFELLHSFSRKNKKYIYTFKKSFVKHGIC